MCPRVLVEIRTSALPQGGWKPDTVVRGSASSPDRRFRVTGLEPLRIGRQGPESVDRS